MGLCILLRPESGVKMTSMGRRNEGNGYGEVLHGSGVFGGVEDCGFLVCIQLELMDC